MSLASRWPQYEPDEIEAAMAVLASGRVNALAHGEQNAAFEEAFARYVGADHAVAMANGTVALEAALKALGIGPGDEVIVPARSFFASVSCVIAVGATAVFADIDPVSHTLCPRSAERMIGDRTRAVIGVHLGGWPCDMDALARLCRRRGLYLVEDCAQAHGAAIAGRRAGSLGDIAAFSFCTDKIMSTGGEGGMVTMSDRALWLRCWAYKDHGKNRDRVLAGGGNGAFQYVHDSFGTNFRMTEMQAAIGLRQLAKLPGWLARRQANVETLRNALADCPAIGFPAPPPDIRHAWYKLNLELRPERAGEDVTPVDVVGRLRAEGISCGTGSCPDMSRESAFGNVAPRRDADLPVARRVGERNLMLAVDHLFDEEAMLAIADAVRRATGGSPAAASRNIAHGH